METFRFTLRLLGKRPLRSLLTVLQVGLGVWIVALILSLNLQAGGAVSQVNQTFGDSLARISVARVEEYPGGGPLMSTATNLRLSDLWKLEESEQIEAAFIFRELWQQRIAVDDAVYSVSLVAETTAGYAQAVDLELVEGQYFTQADQEQKNRVVLLSETVAAQLFPGQSALGKVIELADFGGGRLQFEVIGVYKLQSALLEFFLPQVHLLFPLGASPNWAPVRDREATYQHIYLKAKAGAVHQAVEEAQVLLADRSLQDMEVTGEYFQDSTRFFREQLRTITLFLGAFAFVAILISALGILSMMLVSVVERTREIGLRQALGASKGVIIRQLLNESLVFSILGAAAGLAAAYFSAPHLLDFLLQEFTYPKLSGVGGLHPLAALLALVLAVAVGQFFGLYPAWQGAKLTPVDALREG